MYVAPSYKITEEWREDIMGCTMLSHFDGKRLVSSNSVDDSVQYDSVLASPPAMEDVHLAAVPYGSWENRKEGEMIVWMHTFQV